LRTSDIMCTTEECVPWWPACCQAPGHRHNPLRRQNPPHNLPLPTACRCDARTPLTTCPCPQRAVETPGPPSQLALAHSVPY
jgi:hypothetical protein